MIADTDAPAEVGDDRWSLIGWTLFLIAFLILCLYCIHASDREVVLELDSTPPARVGTLEAGSPAPALASPGAYRLAALRPPEAGSGSSPSRA